MSSSAITTQIAQLKAGNVQNQADSTSIYSNGQWSFKNSTALTSVTITDAGNVGIGVNPPTARLDVRGAGNTTLFNVQENDSGNNRRIRFNNAGAVNTIESTAGVGSTTLAFAVDGTERMRIDASGALIVGAASKQSGERLSVYALGGNDGIFTVAPNGGSGLVYRSLTASGTAAYFMVSNPGTVEAGKITCNGSSTTYATSSDYRLKNEVHPIVGALSKINELKPCTYKWKADGTLGEGFIAHELAEVCPLAVVGEKDAVNEDGSIKPQGIDPSKLVALLTAAIQELSAKVDAQAAEIEALKAK